MASEHIFVKDLDSLLQARNWMRCAPDERDDLLRTTIAQIRTAVLFNDRVAITHAQLFDGIALLEIGPDRLAWELGLSPYSPLPITVLTPSQDPVELREVYFAQWISSAYLACGLRENDYPWLMPTTGPDPRRDVAWIAKARQAWFDAIEAGTVEWRPYPQPLAMGDPVEKARQALPELPEQVSELIDLVCDMPDQRRSAVLDAVDDAEADPLIKECVFRWWNRCWATSVAHQNNGDLIVFNTASVPRATDGVISRADLERALRLVPKRRSRWEVMRERLSRTDVAPGQSLAIEGEIIDQMQLVEPAFFAQIWSNARTLRERTSAITAPARVFDLALAVRDVVDPPQPRRERILNALVRFVLISLAGVLLVLKDAGYLDSTGWLLVLWIGLGIMLSIPWDDVSELWNLRPTKMSAQLVRMDTLP